MYQHLFEFLVFIEFMFSYIFHCQNKTKFIHIIKNGPLIQKLKTKSQYLQYDIFRFPQEQCKAHLSPHVNRYRSLRWHHEFDIYQYQQGMQWNENICTASSQGCFLSFIKTQTIGICGSLLSPAAKKASRGCNLYSNQLFNKIKVIKLYICN